MFSEKDFLTFIKEEDLTMLENQELSETKHKAQSIHSGITTN